MSQVHFIDDGLDSEWKVVVRHDPRSRKVTEEKDVADFNSACTDYPLPTGDSATASSSTAPLFSGTTEDVLVHANIVRSLEEQWANVDEDTFLDDGDYEDEFELQYVEWLICLPDHILQVNP